MSGFIRVPCKWAADRLRILSEEESLLRVYAHPGDDRLLGAAMIAARGEHLAHLLALAIDNDQTAAAMLGMPFYHPSVEELLQTALQDIVGQQAAVDDLPFGLRPEQG